MINYNCDICGRRIKNTYHHHVKKASFEVLPKGVTKAEFLKITISGIDAHDDCLRNLFDSGSLKLGDCYR
jgi:hypothetical protein